MPQMPVISPDMLGQFEREGAIRLDALFPAPAIARAREAVLRQMEKLGLWRDGAWRLPDPRPQWPAMGIKPARDIGHRHPETEALIEEPALLTAVDRLLEGQAFDRVTYPRPQLLVSLPNAQTWHLPDGWHTDSPRLQSGRSPGVQLFTFLEPVEPQGGGTLVIAGSHRLLNDRGVLKMKDITATLKSERFFRRLDVWQDGELPEGWVHGVPVRMIELTGNPGDAWLIDLRLLHSAAPNVSDRPRIMATHRFVRTDVMPELAAAYGWA
jgi:ectoine hydroxylase-related dioxygenase (phytanoyl-CoA dioxygenase family)